MPQTSKPNIILIHGLFMPGVSMIRLRNFFEKQGYTVSIFSYHTTSDSPEKSADLLKKFILSLKDNNIVICHSLGGLLTQHTLSILNNPEEHIQKVISLGTPWQGASILNFMHRYRLDGIVGKSLEILLPKTKNIWQFSDISLGSIAGKSAMGARLIFAPNRESATDGTVTIEETKIDGMTDHTIIPISHTGLIFSNLSAQKAHEFIENNQFKK